MQYYYFENYPKRYNKPREHDGYFVYDYAIDRMYFVEATSPKKAVEVYLGAPVERVSKSAANQYADCYVVNYPDATPANFYSVVDSRPDPLAEIDTLSDEELLDKYIDARHGYGSAGNISPTVLAEALRTEILNRMQGK